MKCAIMQPTYFPWLGYFSLIDAVDRFVFLDNVKIEKHSWHVRNKIKTANGSLFLTVPVNLPKGRLQTLINEALPAGSDWRENHLKSISLTYKKAPYFKSVFPVVEQLINYPADNLADLNVHIITTLARKIGINTKFITASKMRGVAGVKDGRLVAICRALRCREYVSPVGSAAYIEKSKAGGDFPQAQIKLWYHHYEHPQYNQMLGDFLPFMGIVDLLFNCGFKKSLAIIRSGRKNNVSYKMILDMTKKYKIRKKSPDGYYQISPLPTAQEVEKYYLDEFYTVKYQHFNDSSLAVQREEKEFFESRYARINEVCREYVGRRKSLSLFDIGCGYGQSLLYFKKHGFKVAGLETASEAVQYARRQGLAVTRAAIEDFKNEKGTRYDIVTLINVLEHLRDPEKALREIKKKLLKPHGMLVIDAPNEFNDFQVVANKEYALNKWWLCPPNHINYFSPSSLCHLLSRCGYTILEKESSFPLEIFMLFGEVYVGNDKLGKTCHEKRVLFETLMKKYGKKDKLYKLYNYLADLELGRQIVIYCQA